MFNALKKLCLVLLLTLLASSQAKASPIALAFDATVSEAGDFTGSGLPFTLEVGDTIEAKLSVRSWDDLRSFFHGGVVVLDSERWATLELDFKATRGQSLLNTGSLQPAVSINAPPTSPQSGISVGWFSPTNVHPGWSGIGSGFSYNAELSLAGDAGIIADANDDIDIDKLNQLDINRRLGLAFGFPTTVGVAASIGKIRVVPEPGSLLLGMMLVSVLASSRVYRSQAE